MTDKYNLEDSEEPKGSESIKSNETIPSFNGVAPVSNMSRESLMADVYPWAAWFIKQDVAALLFVIIIILSPLSFTTNLILGFGRSFQSAL